MKVQLDINDLQLLKVREIAVKNGIKPTKSELVRLSLVLVDSFSLIDNQLFNQITGFKK
jgi:hypothetical protein